MAWQNRKPSIKVSVDKKLTYSVPRINDNGEEYVDIRFFPNEASDMIWQLLIRNESLDDNTKDFYSILINNREQRKKQ